LLAHALLSFTDERRQGAAAHVGLDVGPTPHRFAAHARWRIDDLNARDLSERHERTALSADGQGSHLIDVVAQGGRDAHL
jgi:hypothetical protein